MNKSMIAYILGWILKLEGLFMLIPILVAIIYREHNGIWFVVVAACSLALGTLITHRKPESNVFYMREGCIATALSWMIMSVVGCLPFFLSGEIPSFTDALFETVSGFTTTGSTILSDVEALSYCMLFWRSFTHWIGGMGHDDRYLPAWRRYSYGYGGKGVRCGQGERNKRHAVFRQSGEFWHCLWHFRFRSIEKS